jgi:murein DD-endopeptidase MepM/ murein hydrolase activator NlpD
MAVLTLALLAMTAAISASTASASSGDATPPSTASGPAGDADLPATPPAAGPPGTPAPALTGSPAMPSATPSGAPDPAAPPAPPGLAGPTTHFSWPLPPPHPVLRPFQPPATPYGPGHRGVDLGGSVGEPVLAAGDGLVLYAGSLFNCELISIEHPGGLRTTYTPVVPSVHVGQEVSRQQQIGTLLAAQPGCPEEVGNNGTGPPVFLYWGVHRDRNYLDPLRLVDTGEVRLLPWPGDGQ